MRTWAAGMGWLAERLETLARMKSAIGLLFQEPARNVAGLQACDMVHDTLVKEEWGVISKFKR